MRLETTGMAMGCRDEDGGCMPGSLPKVVMAGLVGTMSQPTVPSPSPAYLLQTKNMDYYKREVSGARGGGGSWGHGLLGTLTSPLRLAPDRVLQEGHGQDQGEVLHLPRGVSDWQLPRLQAGSLLG